MQTLVNEGRSRQSFGRRFVGRQTDLLVHQVYSSVSQYAWHRVAVSRLTWQIHLGGTLSSQRRAGSHLDPPRAPVNGSLQAKRVIFGRIFFWSKSMPRWFLSLLVITLGSLVPSRTHLVEIFSFYSGESYHYFFLVWAFYMDFT